MSNLKKYFSNLHVLEYPQKSGFFCKGKGWQIYFESNSSNHTLVDEQGDPHKEIIIYATSRERAQYVANLIMASRCLYTGDLLTEEERTVFPKRAQTIEEIEEQLIVGGHDYIGVSDLPVSCLIAAKASHQYKYQHAIFKYFLSLRTMPINSLALDPQHDWIPGKAVSMSPKEHVFYASAISLCYSVFEELALEVRASKEKPRIIDGKWNPEIKNDLERRLISARINLKEKLLWTLRETPTKIERTRKPPGTQTEWVRYRVRDEYWNVIDAIAYASWLRSKIATHKLPAIAKSLSIYDVANVQHLARRLLLETLGFWRYYQKHPSL